MGRKLGDALVTLVVLAGALMLAKAAVTAAGVALGYGVLVPVTLPVTLNWEEGR